MEARTPEQLGASGRAARRARRYLSLLFETVDRQREAILLDGTAWAGSRQNAEDALQETLIVLTDDILKYDPNFAIKTWFRAYYWRKCREIRNKSVARAISVHDLSLLKSEMQEDESRRESRAREIEALSADPYEAVDHLAALGSEIFSLLAKLDGVGRALMVRAIVLDEDQGDIAEDWHISPAALRQRIMATKNKIRRAASFRSQE